jgi:hypothetical protein
MGKWMFLFFEGPRRHLTRRKVFSKSGSTNVDADILNVCIPSDEYAHIQS